MNDLEHNNFIYVFIAKLLGLEKNETVLINEELKR